MTIDVPLRIPSDISGHKTDRRQFLSSLLAISSSAGAAALLRPATLWAAPPGFPGLQQSLESHKSVDSHRSLDPVDPHIRYGITGSLWGEWPNGNLKMSTDL